MNSTRRNSGNTLLIVILLLLLASMMSLFAVNVGMFEQRASGSDLRAKLVNEVAEAGLAQGMEYLRRNSAELKNTSGGSWAKCTATDTSFPCGSIVPARRASMYYWNTGGHDFDGSGAISGWEGRMLPIGNTLGAVSGFPVTYGVGAVLCRVAYKTVSTAPTVCTDVAGDMSPSSVVTLVSVGSIPSEGSRTTLTQTIGSYNILNNAPGKPPIMAAGTVDVTGSLQVVTNPNAGGDGVPVSVWTRKDMIKTGTPNTCYMDEFLRFGAKSSSPPRFEGTTRIITCDDCACPVEHTLSYQSSGSLQEEGIDILDAEPGAGTGTGANHNVLPEEFPCDMFENVFGVRAWEDNTSPPDFFCETKIMTTYKNPNTGVTVPLGADEAFLYANAKAIFTRDATAAGLRKVSADPELSQDPAVVFPGATYPSSAMSGVIWCQKDCDIGASQTLGSPDHPVLVVVDGEAAIQGRVFGMVFLRAVENELDPDTGGSATLDMNAGATVYGSIIVQGQVDKANGTAAIIFNSDVLLNLSKDPSNDKFGGVPGGWADDRVTY